MAIIGNIPYFQTNPHFVFKKNQMKRSHILLKMWTCKKGHLLHKDNTEIHRVHLQSGPAALLSRSPGDHLAGPAPKCPVFAPKNCDDPSFMGRSSLSEAVLGGKIPSSSDTPKYNILLASCIKFYIGMLFCTSQLHIQLYKYI